LPVFLGLMESDITQLLNQWSNGNEDALDLLTPFVYDELRRLARNYLKIERPDHTLQATALVHEAYLQVFKMPQFHWNDRAHFIGVMANLMRRVLVDHAREHKALKRGGNDLKVSLSRVDFEKPQSFVDLVDLDEVLNQFSAEFPRHAKVVELKFFGGLTIDEISILLSENGEKVSNSTVERDWRFARAWLYGELLKV
jgi:RNA polymerase sigma-70 factor, ECF subfamily